jgi:hypothetical protein
MAGRPALRIGQHGTVKRIYLGRGVWLARCRYRDTDGVTRVVQRVGPADEFDKRGKLAEDALIEALVERRPPSGPDTIGLDTLVLVLIDQHITRLAEDGRSVRTLDTYRYDAAKLAKFIAGVRVGEAPRHESTPPSGRCETPTAPQWRVARAPSYGALFNSRC